MAHDDVNYISSWRVREVKVDALKLPLPVTGAGFLILQVKKGSVETIYGKINILAFNSAA